MKNIGQMMKQAQQMQAKMAEMQARLAELEVTGGAGAGLVEITLNGKGEMRRIKLQKADETNKLMGGLKLPPGMKLPF
jgi:DNA-binding YbaB/EbfC family protein